MHKCVKIAFKFWIFLMQLLTYWTITFLFLTYSTSNFVKLTKLIIRHFGQLCNFAFTSITHLSMPNAVENIKGKRDKMNGHITPIAGSSTSDNYVRIVLLSCYLCCIHSNGCNGQNVQWRTITSLSNICLFIFN